MQDDNLPSSSPADAPNPPPPAASTASAYGDQPDGPASPYRPVVAAMLVSALILAGALMGSAMYLGDKVESLREQLSDIGGAPAPQRRQADDEEGPSKVEPDELVAKDDPKRGPKDAKVTIVEFSDYECPFCARFYAETLPTLLKEYGDKVQFVWKDYPLPMHPNAPKASEAAHCAGEQGKYWPYHDILFDNRSALKAEDLRDYAKRLALDMGDFNSCLDSGRYAKKVREGLSIGRKAQVSGTPTFFINGERLVGAQPVDVFKEKIDEMLSK